MSSIHISLGMIVLLVGLALAFDFMNGFHDAANSIATVVSTGVLKPHQAVAFAAFFNVVAISIFQLKVAATIGKGTIDPAIVDHVVVFGALVGAIAWNVITWYYGIPSSSSHALIGGLVGAALIKSGPQSLIASGLWKTIAFIFISPLLGYILGSIMGQVGHPGNIQHVQARIAQDFPEQEPGVGADGGPPGVQVPGGNEGGFNAEAGQGVFQQIMAAAVEGPGGDDMAAGSHQGGDS